ncbi:MAG: uracil-DNA glycosylase [Chloroflexi bacterium]|nr:uracil-DNA glycosylase [Chloroflexota bacterium]
MFSLSVYISHIRYNLYEMIDDFIQQLAQTELSLNLFNQYGDEFAINNGRRHNLRHYLTQMERLRPRVLLVGEAPGYRGCRLTGVPFASPSIITELETRFMSNSGFVPIDEWPSIRKEATATIVWETLATVDEIPLLWNALPFHPHKPGQPQSNRTPTNKELAWGRPFLPQLLHIFPTNQIIAVGNKADTALTRWGILHAKVRHPSHGGKSAFAQGIHEILNGSEMPQSSPQF